MHNVLIISCDGEERAYLAHDELQKLHQASTLTVYSAVILGRAADGTIDTLLHTNRGPIGTATGLLAGTLIGLFGGGTGLLTGAALGGVRGAAFDKWAVRVRGEVCDEASQNLRPDQFLLIADVSEPSESAADELMREIGGKIHRRAHSEVIGRHVEQALSKNQDLMEQLRLKVNHALERTKDAAAEHLESARREAERAWRKTRTELSEAFAARRKILEKQLAEAPQNLKQACQSAIQTELSEAKERLSDLDKRYEQLDSSAQEDNPQNG